MFTAEKLVVCAHVWQRTAVIQLKERKKKKKKVKNYFIADKGNFDDFLDKWRQRQNSKSKINVLLHQSTEEKKKHTNAHKKTENVEMKKKIKMFHFSVDRTWLWKLFSTHSHEHIQYIQFAYSSSCRLAKTLVACFIVYSIFPTFFSSFFFILCLLCFYLETIQAKW